ncbi:hypothetical protein MSPP1_002940 [Malassezia sp. CBS 17886]|nr:hypothetical protein MSPP1_002940 [Malassezia sp. CBS 17886]
MGDRGGPVAREHGALEACVESAPTSLQGSPLERAAVCGSGGTAARAGERTSPRMHSRSQRVRHIRSMGGFSLDAKHGAPAANDAPGPVPHGTPWSTRARDPVFGGFYVADLIVVFVTLVANLLRTCSVAEMIDIVYAGIVYTAFGLACDLRVRWRLGRRHASRDGRAVPGMTYAVVASGARFILSRFPYQFPRVALASGTAGPLVQWRTGGGVAQLVYAFDVEGPPSAPASPSTGFRAYRLRGPGAGDTHVEKPHVLLFYVHGGGFASGSVALYAEALLRVLGHVRRLSDGNVHADCVSVEYDLAPGARYPQALLQCLRCYAHVIEHDHVDPASVVVCGDSVGGTLVMGMLLALSGQAHSHAGLGERDWGALPLPGRAVLISPMVDFRPFHAHAFRALRPLAHRRRGRRLAAPALGASRGEPELDYLIPEALLQYAQVYTGVLRRPRRVAGPGTHACAVLQRGAALIAAPPRTRPHRLVEWVRATAAAQCVWCLDMLAAFLARPLLGRDHPPGPLAACGEPEPAVRDACVTQPVRTTRELAAPVGDLCDTDIFLHPALGDWRRVRLEHGIHVVWGRNELLAADIEAWVAHLRLCHAGSGAAPVSTAVEPGPAGVHVWPFVSMYLAPERAERERGLQELARAVLDVAASAAVRATWDWSVPVHAADTSYDVHSPASMPSDYEEDYDDTEAQLAWESELCRMGVVSSLPASPPLAPPASAAAFPVALPPDEEAPSAKSPGALGHDLDAPRVAAQRGGAGDRLMRRRCSDGSPARDAPFLR